jgi:hypothetical protein
MTRRMTALLAIAWVAAASPAAAQSTATSGRVEVGGGLLWIGPQPLGSRTATETTGTGGTLPLFTETSTLSGAPGVDVRIAAKVTPTFEAEASASYARPTVRTQLGNDFESAPALTATERLQQFTVSGGANWYFLRRSSTVTPFLGASAGYLRQLHENATLAQTGQQYQVGGGVKVMLTSRVHQRVKGAGIRADARALIRSNAIAFDGRRPASLAIGISLFFRF